MLWRTEWILALLIVFWLAPQTVVNAQQAAGDASRKVVPDQDAAAADPSERPQPAVRNDCPSLEDLGYRQKPLADVSLDIRLTAEIRPADCSRDLFDVSGSQARRPVADDGELVFYWAANELSYRPLYFEDPLLERYGQVDCGPLQPAISGVRFLATLPALPYKVGLDPPRRPVYSLGHYRPGSSVPELRYGVSWKWNAALLQVGTWTGLMLLLP